MIKRNIKFDEKLHRYTDEDGNVYTSVTQTIGLIEKEFDSDFWSKYRALDKLNLKIRPLPETRQILLNKVAYNIDYALSLYPQASYETKVVTDNWEQIKDEACTWGTAKHNYLETCIEKFTGAPTLDLYERNKTSQGFSFKITNQEELSNSPLQFTYPKIYNYLTKLIEAGYTLYAEKRVYSAEHLVAGTIDLLCIKGNEFIIVDWKTNKDKLKFTSGYYKKAWNDNRTVKYKTEEFVAKDDRFTKPLDHLQQCKGNTYTMQLSLYAHICELWGLKCKHLLLFHIRPELDKYGVPKLNANGDRIELPIEIYQMPFLKEEASKLLNYVKARK